LLVDSSGRITAAHLPRVPFHPCRAPSFAHPRPTRRPGCDDTSDGFLILDRYHRTDTDGPSPARAADLNQAL
jgi:hypothetical protein